jgi:hypothetical protein
MVPPCALDRLRCCASSLSQSRCQPHSLHPRRRIEQTTKNRCFAGAAWQGNSAYEQCSKKVAEPFAPAKHRLTTLFIMLGCHPTTRIYYFKNNLSSLRSIICTHRTRIANESIAQRPRHVQGMDRKHRFTHGLNLCDSSDLHGLPTMTCSYRTIKAITPRKFHEFMLLMVTLLAMVQP